MNAETKHFIAENLLADIHQLALKSAKYPLVDMQLAIRQINGKQKIKSKVPLFYTTEDILFPAKLSLEQSSSESTAKYKSSLCEGNILVDLTGGFGVDCCFMSDHFKLVYYVERQTELCELAKNNFSVLGKKHIEIINTETENYLLKMEPADWIFIDPARRNNIGNKVVFLSDCEPNVTELKNRLLEKTQKLMIKISPMMDISAALTALPNTYEVHIISVENECKELLLLLDGNIHSNQKIITVNIGNNDDKQIFSYHLNEETTAENKLTAVPEKYLYEPNASIMKSGVYKLVGSKFGLHKLHNNTHLYTSSELKVDFPGRKFRINKIWDNSGKTLKTELKRISKANISTRNYPIGATELRKKLKLEDGGSVYLFACTLSNDKKVIIECEKINQQISE